MDFPHGNPRHHHQHYSPDDEAYPPPSQPYQRPSYDEPPPPTQVTRVHHSSPYNDFEPGPESYYAPPPPPTQVTRVHHSSPYDNYGPGPESFYDRPSPPVVNHGYAPPPPSYTRPDYGYAPPPSAGVDYGYDAPPPPPPNNTGGYSSVEHVSHHVNRPHLPSFAHHDTPQTPEISNKPSVRVYTKAEPNYSLTIRDGRVILARSNPSDPYQHWIKDQKYSTKVKDEEGFPSFSLVNQATGQALKHSVGASHPVQLTPYKPDVLDESVLWTESRDLGDTFRTIRMVNNIKLNVDAWHGDQNHGGVHDGTTIALWEWKKGDNQRWKIVPY